MSGKLLITLVKSPIGYNIRQKRTVRALGLKRMGSTVEHTRHPRHAGHVDQDQSFNQS